MEIGTGIFLSSIFLGTVALFIATKDRWNWKKILLWPLSAIAILGVLGGIGVYIYQRVKDQPRALDEFWGVRLVATIADVRFAKGEPNQKIDDDLWRYNVGSGSDRGFYVVRFMEGQVRFVVYDGPRLWAPSIQGVTTYGSPEDLVKKLGAASHVSRSEDELRRWMSFDQFNLAFLVEKNEIIALGMFNPKTGPIRFVKEASENTRRAH